MEVYMNQTKLTRPPSSLLRSPTFRSSVHSLSTLNETDQSSEEQKPHKPSSKIVQGKHYSPLLVVFFLVFSSLFYIYFSEDLPNFISFSFPLILVCSIALISKKLLFQERNKKLGIGLSFPKGDSVVWTIGDEKNNSNGGEKNIVKEGVEFYSNGDFYEGEFHNGRCNGSGVYNYFVNGRYEGDWIDGRYDGYGIESWARGSRYRGQYRQGLRNGFGVYRFYTGDSYAGEWLNGQSSGIGVQTCSDGSSYIGEFKSGVKHGLGRYHFRNGDKYAGEYFGDKIHGFGVYHFANGHCYEGSWHEGHKQGLGLYIFRNGDTKCGEWDHGDLKIPRSLTTNSVLRVIQASREAAEKATQIPRPNEQVDKAAMAANRAATAARVAAIKAVQNRMNGKLCIMDV